MNFYYKKKVFPNMFITYMSFNIFLVRLGFKK